MVITDSIKIKNYKCFDSDGVGFEKIMPINIIIGKNNSGKSSLIDVIRYLLERKKELIGRGRDNNESLLIIGHQLTKDEISKSFHQDSRGGLPGYNHLDYGLRFEGAFIEYQFDANGRHLFKGINQKYEAIATKYIQDLPNKLIPPLQNKRFSSIQAERDIQPELKSNDTNISPSGTSTTNTIQQILNVEKFDSNLIENQLLDELNNIINPDIHFKRILVQEIEDNKWEIFFIDRNNKRIALSKMGSGIKTILLVLMNLVVRPALEIKNPSDYVFAFEELENNLHPSLQRRLYNYILDYSTKHSTYFFITTHSNIVIDTFSRNSNSQILHVQNDGDKSTVKTISNYHDTKQLLDDIGIRASDLLQSNGVIWVEGPSDRNYLNRWIELLDPTLIEGQHYSIIFYGGRLLSNLTFDTDWFNKNIIPAIKLNNNSFVMIDKDGKSNNSNINETKERISSEIGEGKCWITKGREIENYLSNTTIEKWLHEKYDISTRVIMDKSKKLEVIITESNKKAPVYNISKTAYSAEITDFITTEDLDVLDLKERIENLISIIKEWNK